VAVERPVPTGTREASDGKSPSTTSPAKQESVASYLLGLASWPCVGALVGFTTSAPGVVAIGFGLILAITAIGMIVALVSRSARTGCLGLALLWAGYYAAAALSVMRLR
jgi:hypothetical protein